MSCVAVAASSEIAAEAGARIAREGGNSVDAAIAAAMVSLTTEPGVVSLGAGGFVTLWAPDSGPIVIDGYLEMPGRGLPAERFGRNAWEVTLAYGGGVSTVIGHGSVAVPGGLAALDTSWRQYGVLPWKNLIEPAIEIAREGFPLGQASYNYLVHSGELIYGWHADSRKSLFDSRDHLIKNGGPIHIAHLADSLELIAREGASAMYTGDIARLIAADMDQNEGALTARDLAEYRPVVRKPLNRQMGD
ncbi:MAG: gamma-glutamyltransferase family protein, partial [Gammaproteobacteria bacterium]|nr:gamma-glutamyltransferase family protein [Gammaproteobacteria bacterium]